MATHFLLSDARTHARTQSPIPPDYVFWFHNENLLNFQPKRDGVKVETDYGSRTHSKLEIKDANESDTGNYTCSTSSGKPYSIYVQVLAGTVRFILIHFKLCFGFSKEGKQTNERSESYVGTNEQVKRCRQLYKCISRKMSTTLIGLPTTDYSCETRLRFLLSYCGRTVMTRARSIPRQSHKRT